MPSPLTLEDVERIAALAHLDLTPDEKQLFARQLTQILDYAERLQEVETTDVSATWHSVSEIASLRADERRESLSNEAAPRSSKSSSERILPMDTVPKRYLIFSSPFLLRNQKRAMVES